MSYNPDDWEPVDPSQDDNYNYNYFANQPPPPQEADYYYSPAPQEQENNNNNNNDEWEPVGWGGGGDTTTYYQNFFGPPAPLPQQYQQDRQHDRWWEDLPQQFNQAGAPPQPQQGQPQALPQDILAGALGGFNKMFENTADATAGKPWYQVATEAAGNAAKTGWEAANNVVGAGLDVLGEGIKPIGGLTDWAADSGIPGVQQLGQGVRGAYEGVAEPLFGFTSSAVGDISKGRLPGELTGLYRAAFDKDQYTKDLTQQKQDVVDAYVQAAMQQGIDYQTALDTANRKYGNTAQLAQIPGQQAFAELPAIAQLGTMLLDPIGNKLGGTLFGKPIQAGLKGVGKLADSTGISNVLGKVGEKLESPQQRFANANRELGLFRDDGGNWNYDPTSGIGKEIENRVQDTGQTPLQVIDDLVNNPESEFYYRNLDPQGTAISEPTAQGLRDVVDASYQETPSAAGGLDMTEPKSMLSAEAGWPEAPARPVAEAEAGNVLDNTAGEWEPVKITEDGTTVPDPTAPVQAQAQPITPGPRKIEPPAPGLSDLENMLEDARTRANNTELPEDARLQAYKDIRKLEPQVKAEQDFQSFGSASDEPASARPTTSSTTTTGRELPDYFKAVDVPKRAGETADYLKATQQAIGLKAKALKLDGPIGRLRTVETKPLEQFGPVGTALRSLNPITAAMSRLFLNSPGRVVRDSAGNLLKYSAEHFGVRGRARVNERYNRLFGKGDIPLGMKETGVTADTLKPGGARGQGQGGKPNALGEAAAWVAGPQNEITSFITRKVSRGKYQSNNALTEGLERGLKEHAFKRARLEAFDQAVDRAVANGDIDRAMGQDMRAGRVSQEQLADFVKDRMPAGASIRDAVREVYNPQNFGDEVRQFATPVFDGTGGPVAGAIMDGLDSLPDRLKQYNAQKYKEELDYLNSKYGTPRTRKAKAERDAMIRRQVTPDALQDLGPDHPVVKQLFKDIDSTLDDVYQSGVGQHEIAPEVQQARREAFRQVLQYMAVDRSVLSMKRWLRQEITRNEGSYRAQYKTDAYDRQQQLQQALEAKRARATGQTAKQPAPATSPARMFEQFEKQGATAKPTPDKTGIVPNYPLSKLSVDPERFQYKLNFGEGGNIGSLRGVENYNPELAGVVQVWRDPANGKTYVVNGHNRFNLAKRTGQESMDVRFIKARTAEEARAKGALTNIAEGQGTSLDAAKFFKDTGSGPDVLKAQGLKLEGKVAADGLALSNLTDSVFRRVARGELDERKAVIIGRRVTDPTAQVELVKLLEREGKNLTDGQLTQLADQVAGTKATTERQATLFGQQEIKSFNLLEKAKLADYVASKIADEKREFGTIARNKSGLERVGEFDQGAAGEIANQARQAQDLFNIRKVQVGAISDILNDAARQMKGLKGKALQELQEQTYERVRQELSKTFDQGNTGDAFGSTELPAEQSNLFDTSQYQEQPTPSASASAGGAAPAGEVAAPAKTQAQLDQEARAAGQLDMFGAEVPEATQAPAPAQAIRATPEELPRYQLYEQEIYRNYPHGVMPPQALANMVNRWQRPGAGINRAQYLNDFLHADERIREVTGNTFKLDLDTMQPVRLLDGASLPELLGGGKPPALGPALPQIPKEIPKDLPGVMDATRQILGDNASKKWAEMTPAERDLAFSEISQALGYPDPTNPNPAQERFNIERSQADTYTEALKQDMLERWGDAGQTNRLAQDLNDRQQLAAQKTGEAVDQQARQLAALQSRLQLESGASAYERIKKTYFDYSQKNVIDQILGNLVPFNFWARQNFAYTARYFAAHPYQFAALLHFFKTQEQQNAQAGVPSYARNDILLWTNPDGSKVLWNISSVNPFNPTGDSDSLMRVVPQDDPAGANVVNPQGPLAALFGYDKKNSRGEVTGREKGVISTFIRPNPIFDTLTKTGIVNDLFRQYLGVTDSFGAPDAGPNWHQKQTLSILPGRPFYQEIGAATGLTQFLRKQGLPIADLDIEGPLNEALFGKQAGKSQTKIYQELAKMAEEKEISPEQAKIAIAAYKEGNWTPEALRALDRTEGENALRRLTSLAGFSSVVTNTPRSELTSKLYQGEAQAYGSPDAKGRTITGPDGKKVYQEGDISKFLAAHPGAGVLSANNHSPEKIRQGLADNKTFEAMSSLYDQQAKKKLGAREFNQQVAILQSQNPAYFAAHPLKQTPADMQYNEMLDQYGQIGGDRYDALTKKYDALKSAGRTTEAYQILDSPEYKKVKAAQQQFLDDHPEFRDKYDAYLKGKYGKGLTTGEETDYKDKLGQYQAIGGAKYDALSKMVSDYMAKGDKKSAGVILGSKEYTQAKAARAQYIEDNPDFARRYNTEQETKYGPKAAPATSSSAATKKTTSSSSYNYSPSTSSKKAASSAGSRANYRPAAASAYRPTSYRPAASNAYRPQQTTKGGGRGGSSYAATPKTLPSIDQILGISKGPTSGSTNVLYNNYSRAKSPGGNSYAAKGTSPQRASFSFSSKPKATYKPKAKSGKNKGYFPPPSLPPLY